MKHVESRNTILNENGVALLLVIFIITILTALTVTLSDTVQEDLHVLQNYRASLQAYWTAQSAIQIIAAALTIIPQGSQGYNGPDNAIWHNESQAYQQVVLPVLLLPIGESNSRIGLPNDPVIPTNPPRAVVDENRKLSIAAAAGQPVTTATGGGQGLGLVQNWGQPTERTNAYQFLRLAYLLQNVVPKNLSPAAGSQDRQEFIDGNRARQLAGYILDWIDTPNNSYNNPTGTTAAIIQDQAENTCPDDGLPYAAKNAPMDSIEELALVCGFRQMPHDIILKLAEHITVYPVTTNFRTATKEVLYAFSAAATNGSANQDTVGQVYDQIHLTQENQQIGSQTTANQKAGSPLTAASALQGGNTSPCQTLLAPIYLDKLCNQSGGLGEQSTTFQVDVYGIAFDPQTGKDLARRRIREVIAGGGGASTGAGTGLQPLYYRED